jgi:hypothetical protein
LVSAKLFFKTDHGLHNLKHVLVTELVMDRTRKTKVAEGAILFREFRKVKGLAGLPHISFAGAHPPREAREASIC